MPVAEAAGPALALRSAFMHFSVEQPLEVPRPVAEAALVDPSFYASMTTDNISAPEMVSRSEEDGRVRVAVRYRFTGHLARPARAVLDPGKMTWVIESELHPDDHFAQFRMLPDHYAERLQCSGTYRFEDHGETSVQLIEGELKVHAPVVAGAVERAILMGLRQHMAEHAKLLRRWAATRGGAGGTV